MRRLIAGAMLATLTLAACSAGGAADGPSDQFLGRHGLAGMDGQEVVDHLDRLTGADRPADLLASVRDDEVLLSDGAAELALDLPEDRFYLSVAPYLEQTHECYFHSLTTCQGELVDEEVRVTITDDAGNVLVDEETTTFGNGFAGFWLPDGVEGTVRVTHDGHSGAVPFATDAESPTCMTTLQLA